MAEEEERQDMDEEPPTRRLSMREWKHHNRKGLEDDNVPVTIPPTQRSLSNVRLKSDCARYGPPLFLHWQHWGWQHFGAAKRQMQTSNCWLVCLIRAWQS